MSLHQECVLDVLEKAQVAQECRDIVHEASQVKPGERPKAQKRRAYENLETVSYGKIVRAWNGRGGPKLLRELREARRLWRLRCNAESIATRLERLERAIAGATADNPLPSLAGGEALLAGLVKSTA